MKLPNADKAIVEPAKVREYLLSMEHPVGRSKARFFASVGFSQNDWQQLAIALRELAKTGDAEPGPASRFGQKYVVRGKIESPTGRLVAIESAWIVLNDDNQPRLVTAYPGTRS